MPPLITTPTPFRLPSPERRHALQAMLMLASGGFAVPVLGATHELRIVTSDDGDTTRKILEALNRRLPGYQSSPDPRVLRTRRGSAVYLALGPAALQEALHAELQGPLLSLFTSSEAYTRLMAGAPRDRQQGSTTAIFAEAAPEHQMRLIRALYGRRVSVGVLITTSTAHMQPWLRLAARSNDLALDIQIVEPGENPIHALSRVRSAVVLLAVPDRDIYTATNVRNILVSTYRRNQPMIGFSTSLVQAGTLAAAYSTIDDTVAQAQDVVGALVAGRVPAPQFPIYWRVAINDNVAKSMNVVVEDSVRVLGNPAP